MNGIILLWIEESSQLKIIAHIVDLHLFRSHQIDSCSSNIPNIYWWSFWCFLLFGRFVVFYHIFVHYFCFVFLAILDFWINVFFSIMNSLNLIECNKQTTSLPSTCKNCIGISHFKLFMKFCEIGIFIPKTNASW